MYVRTLKQAQDVTEMKLVSIFMSQQPMVTIQKKLNKIIKKTNLTKVSNVKFVISSATEQQQWRSL